MRRRPIHVTAGSMPGSRVAAILGLAALAFAAACGHKGSPMPPLKVRPTPVSDLKVRQRGERIILTLSRPAARTDGSEFEDPVLIRLRQVQQPLKTQRKGGRARLREIDSWVVPQSEWERYVRRGLLEIPISVANISVPQALDGSTDRLITFVVEVQEGKRKKSQPSDPITLTLCESPEKPESASAVIAPGGVKVAWSRPPSEKSGVHVYRAAEDSPFPQKPYRKLDGRRIELLDEGVVMGKRYRYQIRFTPGEDAEQCESEPADAEVTAQDKFAPEPPDGLAAAAERDRIRIFWLPGKEADLGGYKVYRREGTDGEWVLLTPEPIRDTTYADDKVRGGVLYFYSVSAVDNAVPPNESERSKASREVLP